MQGSPGPEGLLAQAAEQAVPQELERVVELTSAQELEQERQGPAQLPVESREPVAEQPLVPEPGRWPEERVSAQGPEQTA